MMKISAIPEENMSNLTSASNDSSTNNGEMFPPPYFSAGNQSQSQSQSATPPPPAKKKRSQPGHPDPGSEVIALSPRALLATNRFVCEICNKGFQRDQNLQLHRRGHNLPWKLKQRSTKDVRKKVYVCPETSCVHHDPSRALGDLTGIKKHFCRKHGEKKWKCEKCSKKYAVQSDWKAHSKTCGTREYRCDCGTLFSRRDSFITHRAFCDALAEENNKVNQTIMGSMGPMGSAQLPDLMGSGAQTSMGLSEFSNPLKSMPQELLPIPFKPMNMAAAAGMFSSASGNLFGSPRTMPSSSSGLQLSSNSGPTGFGYGHQDKNLGPAQMSATALLQKAAQMGATATNSPMMQKNFVGTTMAGPDPGPGPGTRPNSGLHGYDGGGFNMSEQQASPFSGAFAAGLMQKGTPQEVAAHLFDGGGGSAASDMVMYGGMLMDQSLPAGFFKSAAEGGGDRSGMGRIGGGGDDMTTVDFMGVGGSMNLQHEMEAMNQQRLQNNSTTNPFHHHHHGDADVDKPLYNTF